MRRWLAWIAIIVCLAAAVTLDARPGGGETYSSGRGGGSSGDSWGGGGGGGGDGDLALLILIVRLCIRYPLVGVPLVLIALAFLYLGSSPSRQGDFGSVHTLMEQTPVAEAGPPPLPAAAPRLDTLATIDRDFSSVLFEDFAFRLYATAHGSRHDVGKLDELAPYLSESARQMLAKRQPIGRVTGVVVGAMHLRRVEMPAAPAAGVAPGAIRVSLEFEANYSVGDGPGRRRFVVEDWVFQRAETARTRPPSAERRFPCPNCGAPWRTEAAAGTQKCASCGEVVDNGRFDWQVAEIRLRRERLQIPGLEQDAPERGTSLPTHVDATFDQQWATLLRDDAGVTAASIDARLRHVYRVLNEAWTAQDLDAARPVLSDGLADYLQYWLDAYAAEALRNVLEDMRVIRHVLVKLRRDRYFDALTVRIWATGKDYVIRTTDGRHIRGSRIDEREYSEYWTLIRSAARRGEPRADDRCGGCGAPLTVTMAGACGHCGAHVTAGEFDWVLSKIEQDDSYQG